MLETSPLWPADVDHLRIDSPMPRALAEFYARALGMSVSPLGGDTYLAEGQQRRLAIGRGEARGHPWSAFALAGDNIEISAERETLPEGEPGTRWTAGGKALNLWGPVWVRDTVG